MDTLLRDPSVEPTDDVLSEALGKSFAAYKTMREIVTGPPHGLEIAWRFYNDGKAWLGKACFGKKTVFWMSIWPGFFKILIYFTDKTVQGVLALDISPKLKDAVRGADPAVKYIALTFEMRHKTQIRDLLKAVEYKKSLK